VAREAQAHKLDTPPFHLVFCWIDFLQHDLTGMEREAAGLMGKPGVEDRWPLSLESDTAAYVGQFAKALELTRHAADSARRAGEKETAAYYEAEAALREALVGNTGLARQQAQASVARSNDRDTEAVSATALGLAGDAAQARRLTNDLDKRFPKDTIVQSEYLPMIRAATILGSGDASKGADKAIEALATAAPYELGFPSQLYPVYLRAEAYLAVQQGAAAATEFQKILDHPGIVLNQPIGALAHLGLGRAYALETGIPGSAALAKARTAYQDFFALWKDADPDIPILKQARAEHAKLQ
jgi:hypothetical protein